MDILVIGGTRYFGIPMVNALLSEGHNVTIATRGKTPDSFGEAVNRILFERTSPQSIANAFSGRHFDVVIDKLAYCSNDVKAVMDVIDCDTYIQMSSTAVYEPKHPNTVETDFDGVHRPFVWCDRTAFPYDEIKRHAECALWQHYSDRRWIAVRYPFVTSVDDYTKRLRFYAEHVVRGLPMMIDNLDAQMSLIHAKEAGEFMAYLVNTPFTGAVNGASHGTISPREILQYVQNKTGKEPILDPSGDAAPYNGEPSYSINTDLAESLGFRFSHLHDWIYDTLDTYIKETTNH